MPPPPHARYNLCICCGSSNPPHKVFVLVCLAPPCSGGPSGAGNSLTWCCLFSIMMLLASLGCMPIWTSVVAPLRPGYGPVQQVTHCALPGALLQLLVHVPAVSLLLGLLPCDATYLERASGPHSFLPGMWMILNLQPKVFSFNLINRGLVIVLSSLSLRTPVVACDLYTPIACHTPGCNIWSCARSWPHPGTPPQWGRSWPPPDC